MARARRRPPSRFQQQAQQQGQRLLSDWATLTWVQDGTKLGPVPLVAANWLILALLAGLLYLGTPSRSWTGLALAGFLLYTLVRAGAVMPRRRKALTAIYTAMQRPAALPRSTSTTPVNPASYLSVASWGPKARPEKFTLTVGPDSPATTAPYLRTPLEQAIQKATPPPRDGQEWVFDWADASHVTATSVPAEDPRVWQRGHDRKMARSLGDRTLFDGARNAADHDYALTVEARTESEAGGATYPYPTKVVWAYGGFDASDPQFRERVTAEFDRKVRGPGVWVYDWTTDGELIAELVADDDLRARRKVVARKITSDVYSLIRTTKNSSIDCEVTKWMPEGKRFPEHYPVAITIDFGTLNLGDRRIRNKFEEDFDTAMEASHPGLTWLYDWTPGGTTRLVATAYPSRSEKARRKVTERNLRNVIESKFGSSKNFVDCDILEWQPQLSPEGAALVQVAEVKFGSMDVNARDTRDGFQDHWDSLSKDNDWHYSWDAPKGKVTITAVPPLPEALAFPPPGTPEFDEVIALAKRGVFRFGPQKGGGWLDWDLGETPHGLIGGKTGSGKALDTQTPICTPDGWRTMGELSVGDRVFDEAGRPTTVTGVYDQPLTDTCFEVKFSDGSTVVCDDQHLWWTETRTTRVARTQQRFYADTRHRRPWLAPETTARLRAAAQKCRPDDTATLPEVAALAGLTPNRSGPLRALAASIGAAEEVRTEARTYHYREQIVFQRQKVTLYEPTALADFLVTKVRSARSGSLSEHGTAVMAAAVGLRDGSNDRVCSSDLARTIGVDKRQVNQWLQGAAAVVPHSLDERVVQLTVPERTVVRPGPAVPLYPKQALLDAVADHGDRPMWDQRSATTLGQVRTVNEIRHSLRAPGGHANHSVPVAAALQFPEACLPIAPYTLGVWLGDGHSWHAQFTSIDPEVADTVREDGYSVHTVGRPQGVNGNVWTYTVTGLRTPLRQSGLLRTRTAPGGKHIPRAYLQASQAQRRALLAGLLDTDGTVGAHGRVEFDNTNRQLALDVLELARGLGYRATITEKAARLDGRECGRTYRVAFTTRDVVFRLPRKCEIHLARTGSANPEKHQHRYIVDIRKVQPRPMRCISVDSPTRQFLCGDALIPTHNSVALSIVLFYAMYLPDDIEIIVCDPKRTDFTWTPEFPSVVRFAATDTEICQAVAMTRERMDTAQTLLNRTQVRKLSWLRDKYAAEPDLESIYGPVPKRTILFFDEIADFLAKGADSDMEELKDEARASLEKIARLGRALETNIVCAAQKPDAKIISTQLRSQLGFRLGVGPLDQYESEQILNSQHGTRFPEAGTPKGRAWGYDPKNGYRQVQVMFLPDDSMPAPWDPSMTLQGAKELSRNRLTEIGYQQITVPNADGGEEPRWVILDEQSPGEDGDAAATAGSSADAENHEEIDEAGAEPADTADPAPMPAHEPEPQHDDEPTTAPVDERQAPTTADNQPDSPAPEPMSAPRTPRRASRAPGPAADNGAADVEEDVVEPSLWS
ncbi:LAGLIDADG family homing endonuclease [Dietzia sp. 179-F 9C3 NHS]|uniref:LAGLIDADG family homing endonuclease n=1 Tax=Dietzia sp. 179-F 9C3 NHS TaxID=3374295 RepID=UPI00387A02B5